MGRIDQLSFTDEGDIIKVELPRERAASELGSGVLRVTHHFSTRQQRLDLGDPASVESKTSGGCTDHGCLEAASGAIHPIED